MSQWSWNNNNLLNEPVPHFYSSQKMKKKNGGRRGETNFKI